MGLKIYALIWVASVPYSTELYFAFKPEVDSKIGVQSKLRSSFKFNKIACLQVTSLWMNREWSLTRVFFFWVLKTISTYQLQCNRLSPAQRSLPQCKFSYGSPPRIFLLLHLHFHLQYKNNKFSQIKSHLRHALDMYFTCCSETFNFSSCHLFIQCCLGFQSLPKKKEWGHLKELCFDKEDNSRRWCVHALSTKWKK